MAEALEKSAVRAVAWRVLPLLFAAYFAAYIDRVNVGFASLSMNTALGLNAEQYGLAAGLFFIGYVACAVPSNLVLAQLGGAHLAAHPDGGVGPGLGLDRLGQDADGTFTSCVSCWASARRGCFPACCIS